MSFELSPRGEELTIKTGCGGDWVWAEGMVTTDLRRLFLWRLSIVAPQVLESLQPIIDSIVNLDLKSDVQNANLEYAIRRPISAWAAAFPEVLPEFEAWLRQWHLKDHWFRKMIARDVVRKFPAALSGGQHLSYFTEAGLLDESGVPLSRGGILPEGIDDMPRPGIIDEHGEQLPKWWVLFESREKYRRRVELRGAPLSLVDAWLDQIEAALKKHGLVKAPMKESFAHMDALIRFHCLEWPWDCVVGTHARERPDGIPMEKTSMHREVNKLAERLELTLRQAKRGRRSRDAQKHVDGCLCL